MLGADSKPVPAFHAAGEVAGGVHGNNRLGSNSRLDGSGMCAVHAGRSLAALAGGGKGEGSKSGQACLRGNSPLDCVVYARVAGAVRAKYGGRERNGFRHHQASHPRGVVWRMMRIRLKTFLPQSDLGNGLRSARLLRCLITQSSNADYSGL